VPDDDVSSRVWTSKFVRVNVALLILAACSLANGQTVVPNLSLEDAVQAALEAHPALKAAQSGKQVAEASLAGARTGRMPTLQVKGTLTQGNNPVYVFGSLLEQSRFGPANFALDALNSPSSLTNLRSEVVANMPLFDRHQTDVRIRQATIGVEQSDLQRQGAEQQVRFDVIQAYFGLIAAKAQAELAAASVRMAREDVDRATARRDAGMTVDSDVLTAQVQQAEFRQRQIQADADIVSAIAALNIAMGRSVDTPVSVPSSIGDRSFEIRPLPESIDNALKYRPDYLTAVAIIRAAEEGISSETTAKLPRVDLFGSYGASTHYLWSGSTDYTAGASVSIDLFDAGRRSRVDRAQASRDAAAAQAAQLASQVRLDVVRSRQNQIAAQERLEVVRLTAAQSEEVYRVTQERYQAGLTTIAEVLRTETAVVQARTGLIGARNAQRLSYAGVLFSTGMLTDERLVADSDGGGQ